MKFFRHIADHLTPRSRTLFRSVHADLMESVLPSPVVVGVASTALHHHLLMWRTHITHLTMLIDSEDSEEIIHVIPSLENLVWLDIRSVLGNLNLWNIQYLKNLQTCHVVAGSVQIPQCWFPELECLRIVAGADATVCIDKKYMPHLETFSIRTRNLNTTYCDLPEGLESVTLSVHIIPSAFIESLYNGISLRHLSFEWCRMTYLPQEFGRLENLESLSLRGNFLTIFNEYGERDGCMLPISRLRSLRHLDLSDNVCLEMQSPSIQLPENLETLDVRGSRDSYYNEPFFEGGSLGTIKTLYTSRLPTKETIRDTFQNLRTLVYAPPDPIKAPFQMMVDLFPLTMSLEDIDLSPQVIGTRVPVHMDGLSLFVDGPMHPDDCIRYKEL